MCKKGRTGAREHQEVAHATLKGGTVANAAKNNASLWLGLVWFGEAGARNPAGSALRKAQRKRAQPIPPTARRGQLQGQSNSPQGGSQTSHTSSNRASLQQWRGRPHSSGKSSSLTGPQKGHAQHPYAEAAERFAVPSLTRSQDLSPRTTPTTRTTLDTAAVLTSWTWR